MPRDAQLERDIQDAKTLLCRVDEEIAAVKAGQAKHAKSVSDCASLATQITTSTIAQMNLSKLSHMAIKLEGAYHKSSLTLRESAEASESLRNWNLLLSLAYAAVAVGKVMDIVASVTGTGKWVTSAKTCVLDMAESVKKDDPKMWAAQGANLALIAGKEAKILKDVAALQTILNSAIELFKDLKVALSAKDDLNKVKADLGQWVAKFASLMGKLDDVFQRVSKLYEEFIQEVPKFDVQGVKAPKNWWGDPTYRMKYSDYFASLKYAIEAAVNFYQMVRSIMDTAESWNAASDARSQADRQLVGRGNGHFEVDLVAVAGLHDSDLIVAIHGIDSAPDARQLAYDTGMKAKELAAAIPRMQLLLAETNARIGPASMDLNASIERLRKTDEELQGFQPRLERYTVRVGQNSAYSLRDSCDAAAFVGAIDEHRNRIRTLLGGR